MFRHFLLPVSVMKKDNNRQNRLAYIKSIEKYKCHFQSKQECGTIGDELEKVTVESRGKI